MQTEKILNNPLSSDQWFVLNTTGYTGPFNSSELILLISSSKIGGQNLVWREGLIRWQKLNELTPFSIYLELNSKAKNQIFNFSDTMARDWLEEQNENIQIDPLLDVNPDLSTNFNDTKKIKDFRQQIKSPFFSLPLLIIVLCLVGLLIGWKLNRSFDESDANTTPKARFVYSQSEFFITSNLPTGSVLTLTFTPLKHTFYNEPKEIFSQRIKIENRVGVGHSPVSNDGESINPGYYTTALVLNGTVLFRKDLFFGEIKFDDYQIKIQEFNVQKKIIAETEITELSQVVDSLVQQTNALYSHYTTLQTFVRKKSRSEQIAEKWKLSTNEWITYQSQIGAIVESWNLSKNKSYIYLNLFLNTEQLEIRISGLKSAINSIVIELKFDQTQQIEKQFFDLQTEISKLKSKIDYLQAKLKP